MPVGYSIYRDKPSAIHQRVDPRTKMLWLVALFGLALCFSNALVLGVVTVALGIVARIAHIRLREIRGMLLLALWLVLLSVVIWPLYITSGPLLFTLGGARITAAGILFGLAMGLRIDIMLMAATIWMITTSPQRLTAGMLGIGLPYKAGLAMSLALRFVPLMNAEQRIILEAQRARGLELARGNPIRRMLKAAALLVPLFTRAFITVQSLTVAMDARGFGARKGRTSIVELKFSRLDQMACVLGVVLLVAAIVLALTGSPITRGLLS
jgi:energy-coupling factor transport system permease protein